MSESNVLKTTDRIGVYRLLLAVLLLILFMTGFYQNAYSASEIAVFTVDQRGYTVNGQMMSMDAAPFIENGRVYVPVRFLAGAVGVVPVDIGWNASAKEVTLKKGSASLSLTIGSTTLRVNGSPVMMDTAPLIRADRTFLPARYVAEAFGFTVSWNGTDKTVTVARQVVSPQVHAVEISGFAFSPGTLTIQAGDTVMWTNRDSAQHTITFTDFTSDRFGDGGTYSHTFATPGTFTYRCSPHPSMQGTVIVE